MKKRLEHHKIRHFLNKFRYFGACYLLAWFTCVLLLTFYDLTH